MLTPSVSLPQSRMASSSSNSMAADFSNLPRNLLSLALSKLSIHDYARFGAVCRTWHHACSARDHPPAPQIPWLMLPGHNERTLNFLSLSEADRVYVIHQPDPMMRYRLHIGSSDGWLFTVCDITYDMYLLNPVTGVQIPLPSLRSLNMRFYFFVKGVMFKTARDVKDGFMVMLILEPQNVLVFARAGDETWTALKGRIWLHDVISYRGQIYTVDNIGTIDVWEPDGQSFKPRLITGGQDFPRGRKYLVESSLTGDLLMIVRHLEGHWNYDLPQTTQWFKAWKLDECTSKLAEINDLGDQALFLGNNRSMALSVRKHPELKRSCIYFTDDPQCFSRRFPYHPREVGVYDLVRDRFDHLAALNSYRTWPPPIWLSPPSLS